MVEASPPRAHEREPAREAPPEGAIEGAEPHPAVVGLTPAIRATMRATTMGNAIVDYVAGELVDRTYSELADQVRTTDPLALGRAVIEGVKVDYLPAGTNYAIAEALAKSIVATGSTNLVDHVDEIISIARKYIADETRSSTA